MSEQWLTAIFTVSSATSCSKFFNFTTHSQTPSRGISSSLIISDTEYVIYLCPTQTQDRFLSSFNAFIVLFQMIFRKLADVRRERELAERRKNDPPLSELSSDHPVRKLISRFRKISDVKDGGTKETERSKNSTDNTLQVGDACCRSLLKQYPYDASVMLPIDHRVQRLRGEQAFFGRWGQRSDVQRQTCSKTGNCQMGTHIGRRGSHRQWHHRDHIKRLRDAPLSSIWCAIKQPDVDCDKPIDNVAKQSFGGARLPKQVNENRVEMGSHVGQRGSHQRESEQRRFNWNESRHFFHASNSIGTESAQSWDGQCAVYRSELHQSASRDSGRTQRRNLESQQQHEPHRRSNKSTVEIGDSCVALFLESLYRLHRFDLFSRLFRLLFVVSHKLSIERGYGGCDNRQNQWKWRLNRQRRGKTSSACCSISSANGRASDHIRHFTESLNKAFIKTISVRRRQ